MSLAITAAARRRWNRHPVSVLFAVSASLIVAACSTPAPAAAPEKSAPTSAATAAKPTSAPSKPASAASPGPSPSPSPSPAPLFSIVDPTLADATPWVSVRLSDGEPRIVSGWRLEVGSQSVTIPGNAIIQPGDMLILHVGDGQSSDREIFLGADSHALALAAAPGTAVRLVNADGIVVAETTVPRY